MRNSLLGLAILFLAPALASGQTVNAPDRLWGAQPQSPPSGESEWGNLQRLRVGDKVEVVRYNLSKHKGKMLAWTEESISLRLKNQEVTIPREDVYRVTWLSKSKRGRNALIGLVVGAGVGAVFGANIRGDLSPGDRGYMTAAEAAGVMSLFFGGIGAGVGAAFPSHPTIYRAPRRKSGDGK